MPTQWTSGSQVFLPDGCDVQVQASGDGSYTSIGNILGDCAGTHNFDINEVIFNDGQKITQYRNETINLDFTLANLNGVNIGKFSGGMFTVTETAASTLSDIANQTLAANGWSDVTPYALAFNSTAEGYVKGSDFPTITSVTASSSGVLAADDDYTIIPDSTSTSGYSIVLNAAGTATVATTESVVIIYTSVDPVASTKITTGKSSGEFSASKVKFIHTDDSGLTRYLEVYAATPNSGSFAFSFRGTETGEVEQMPITMTGKVDATRTSGDQLFGWGYDNGAA